MGSRHGPIDRICSFPFAAVVGAPGPGDACFPAQTGVGVPHTNAFHAAYLTEAECRTDLLGEPNTIHAFHHSHTGGRIAAQLRLAQEVPSRAGLAHSLCVEPHPVL